MTKEPQNLEPIAPKEAVSHYLDSRANDASRSTIQNHRYRLKQFLKWCDTQGIENLNEMTGRLCEAYKNWRIADGGVSTVTLENQLRTFRVFLRYAESIEAVEQGLPEKIIVPKISKGEGVRDTSITHEEAEAIIDHLQRFRYASKEHVLFHLLYHTGMRRGTCVSLDLSSYERQEGFLKIRHRPNAANPTPLKLQDEAERNISLVDDSLVTALNDYIDRNRIAQEESDGREPLFTSQQGRLSGNSMQRIVYMVTRPCFYADKCPHDKTIEDCEAVTDSTRYSRCPSSVSPHAIRRSAITNHLDKNVSKEIASERMNVSVDTLSEHYDVRDREQKRMNRRRELDNLSL